MSIPTVRLLAPVLVLLSLLLAMGLITLGAHMFWARKSGECGLADGGEVPTWDRGSVYEPSHSPAQVPQPRPGQPSLACLSEHLAMSA